MELSMVLKSISNYLILLEDNINAELVNQISNFQLDLIYNTELNKLKKNIQNKLKTIKKRNKKLNLLLNKSKPERNKLLTERRINLKNQLKYKILKIKLNNQSKKNKKPNIIILIINMTVNLNQLHWKKVNLFFYFRIQCNWKLKDWLCQTSYCSQSYFWIT